MNIHEYQAKALLGDYGIPLPRGSVAKTSHAAEAAARDLGGGRWAVKAQVHAGARGKAGGVRLLETPEAVGAAAAELLGSKLVTSQTGPEGKTVRQVYIEEAMEAEREVYLAILVDRSAGQVALIGSRDGGAEIEEETAATPETVQRLLIDPDAGLKTTAAEKLAADLGFEGAGAAAAASIMEGLYRAFHDLDASLIEINPLAVTKTGELKALDIKASFDDNALYRQNEVEALRDEEEVDPTELEAQRYEINYVKLDGSIGCMVNGAGLALATIDLLRQKRGRPADFMDVRPGATRDQVAQGFALLIDNPDVRAILVNVYGGGILRCDTIAEGIAQACKAQPLTVPLVIRAAGTNREQCRQILESQAVPAVFAKSMAEAADKVIAAVKGRAD